MPTTPPEDTGGAERTADGRYLVVGGRRWRATDPSIPEPFRAELVTELMAARRAVGAGQRAADDTAVAAARQRVQDAKVALGERGQPWWEPPEPEQSAERIRSAIRTLLAHRGAEKSICPSDVARVVGGEAWRRRMDDVRSIALELARAGEVRVTAGTTELDPDGPVHGPIRIRPPLGSGG